MSRHARALPVLVLVLAALGCWQLASAGWIHAKALVAQHLIASAWAGARDGGPAHVGGTASPGSWGNAVIVAHRDTHFRFLKSLAGDDEIDVESAYGARSRYRVREVMVVDKNETRVLDPDSAQLTLITCYPFDALRSGTPWRYVVVARRIA